LPTLTERKDARPRPTLSVAAVVALFVLVSGCGQNRQSSPLAAAVSPAVGDAHQLPSQQLDIMDIAGVTHRPFNDPLVRAVALVFLVPDCPISNSYAPEINRLHADYASRGVRIFLIQVDPELSIKEACEHARQYQLQPPVVLDKRHVWVRKIGATMTPQAAVLSPAGTLLYLGRIDNRYVGLGKRREQVTVHDLRDALDAVLAGRSVSQPSTEAIGCPIPDISTGE
jgi:hypothetical protein